MSLLVVDALETIQIEDQQRQRATISHGPGNLLTKVLIEGPRIEEASQRIGRREEGKLVRIVSEHATEQRERHRRGSADVRVRGTVTGNLVAHRAP